MNQSKEIKAKKPKKRNVGAITDEKLKELIFRFGGLQSDICRYLKKDAGWMSRKINGNPELVQAVEDAKSVIVDEAMKSLRECIRDKKETSIIFTLKTLGRNRGFVEHAPVEQVDSSKLKALGDFFAALSPKVEKQRDQGSNGPKNPYEK